MEKVFSFKRGAFSFINWTADPFEFEIYEDLFEEQMQIKRSLVIQDRRVLEGKILVIEIDNNFMDGASELYTKGFIDGNDCPPIDTWFYLIGAKPSRILYAWIPHQFVSVVQDGIEVNATEPFKWICD